MISRMTLIWIKKMQNTLTRRFGLKVLDYACRRARKIMKDVMEMRHN